MVEEDDDVSEYLDDSNELTRFFADPSELVYRHEMGRGWNLIGRSRLVELELILSSRPSMSSQVLMTESGESDCSSSV